MKKLFPVMVILVVALGCGGSATETPAPEEEIVEQAPPAEEAIVEVRHDQLYVCGCGDDCDCGAVAMEAGTCDCGSEMVQAHMLKIDDNVATVCDCAGDCTCELDPEDPTMCGCGEPVRQVSLEGKGLYYCNCGGSCTCNHVAAEPGECGCGMELVTS